MNRASGRMYISDIRKGMTNCAEYKVGDRYGTDYVKGYYGARKMGIVYGMTAAAYTQDFYDTDKMAEHYKEYLIYGDLVEEYFYKGAEVGIKLNKSEKKRNILYK